MKVIVTVKARLKGDAAEMRELHDSVTGATKEMAQQAGDVSHRIFLNPQDSRDFLGIDEWDSVEHFQAFAGHPQIQDFFSKLFDGEPEVMLWSGAGWNEW